VIYGLESRRTKEGAMTKALVKELPVAALVPLAPESRFSWTLVFNTIVLIYGALEQAGIVTMIPGTVGMIIAAAGNFLLRFKTEGPAKLVAVAPS
jgi:hypothetical protein